MYNKSYNLIILKFLDIDLKLLKSKEEKLESTSKTLKEVFVGIDNIIDELINQIRIWYLMPELLTRPVIINLWGMTGVGKTDLIRRLVKLLTYEDKFAEIELSNSSNSAYFKYSSSINEVLQRYSITPEEPCIIFFDEIQKFRTIDETRKDIFNQQFQDFWELLSDGKLSKRDQMNDVEELFVNSLRSVERDNLIPTEEKNKNIERLSSWELRKLRPFLGLSGDLTEMGNITPKDLLKMLEEKINSKKMYETNDYRKALIIISGNLDEAYEMAKQTDEAEVDPDIFHAQTNKISIIEIKEALSRRFKPEQVSRFGNIHLIYPSLKKIDFINLIEKKSDSFSQIIFEKYKIKLFIEQSLKDLIYKNGVFPVQGVRPVFSAITDVLETNISKVLYKCLVEGFNKVRIGYNFTTCKITAVLQNNQDDHDSIFEINYVGRIDKIRQDNPEKSIALTSIHEAGHSVIYAKLFNLAPLQLKSNLASGYASGFTFPHLLHFTREIIKKQIQVLLGGQLAEELIFGSKNTSTGSAYDLEQATILAADYIRRYGLDDTLKMKIVPITHDMAPYLNTDFDRTNNLIKLIIDEQKEAAEKILQNNKVLLISLGLNLLEKREMTSIEFQEIAKLHGIDCEVKSEEYKVMTDYKELLNNIKI